MPVLQIVVTLDRGDPAPLEAVLTSLGASSITLEDAADAA